MYRIYMTAAALALLLAAPAAAGPRPRSLNWHLRKKPVVSTGTVSGVDGSAGRAREPVALMGGRWTPEVRTALEKLMYDKGRGAPGYDAKVPPVAVLPWS